MGKPTGGREIPPPRAITIKTERKIMWKENHSEKDAHYALALALALSLTACGQPNAEQPTDPAPSTSVPEPIAPPEPIKDPAPESEPEQTPAAPVETEDTQPPEETESQEDEVQLFTKSVVQQQQTSKPSSGSTTTQQGGGQQQTSTDTQGPTPGYNPWEDDYSNVVIDTRTEEQKQADIKKTQEASEGITGTIQAGGLGGN